MALAIQQVQSRGCVHAELACIAGTSGACCTRLCPAVKRQLVPCCMAAIKRLRHRFPFAATRLGCFRKWATEQQKYYEAGQAQSLASDDLEALQYTQVHPPCRPHV